VTTDPQTARYRHRTTEVEAVQWTGSNADQLRAFAGADFDEIELDDRVEDPDQTAAVREADHGTWRGLKPGDWVVKLEGGLYEFSAADFASQYEAAPSAVAQSAPAETALRDRIAALFRHPPGAERLGDATPGEIADAVLAELPDTARLHDQLLTQQAELAHLRGLLRTENGRANSAIDRETTTEEAGEAYRLAVSAALRLGTGATWEAIRDRAEDLTAEVEELTEARVRQMEVAAAVDRAAVLNEAADHLARQAADASPSARDVILADAAELHRMAVEAQQQTETPACPDPIECGHEAALGQAQQEVKRLGLMVDEYGHGASTLSEKLRRVRRLHDQLAEETDLASPDDSITRGAAAKRIATALDGPNPAGLPSCDVEFEGGGHCAKPAGHRPPGSDDPHVPAVVPAGAGEEPADETPAPRTTWIVESPKRGEWKDWSPPYEERSWGLDRYESAIGHVPGRPFRLVRATTTYAVEAEHQPAAVSQPGKER
jgi:hypothetical protein